MPSPLGSLEYTWPFFAAAILGYLIGSIPFGLVLTRLAGYGDIRKIGSGNIGATNVLRTGSKGLALATVLLDGGKGAAAALFFGQWGPDMAVLAGAGSYVGHCFPVWLKFKGGKGVATAAGILLVIAWQAALVTCATWLVVAIVFRMSSLAALVAATLAPVYAWYLVGNQAAQLALFLAVLIYIRHHENIGRLIRGTESKISFRSKKPPPTENASS
ncbi:MAG: glycerol-3-phosphate 1-O-acyltransferase PlsY [Alphaproteobacteria bacterium]|nr:glycerol-3-phosphate 1-O-acyltransferase PlsY [Alphaproteobacteria bacterium]